MIVREDVVTSSGNAGKKIAFPRPAMPGMVFTIRKTGRAQSVVRMLVACLLALFSGLTENEKACAGTQIKDVSVSTSFERNDRYFDGTRHVSIGPVKTLHQWTISAWARPTAAGNGKNVLSNDRSGWNDDVLFGIRPEETYAGGSDNRWGIVHQDRTDQVRTAVYDTEDVVPGQWYHVAGTSDGRVLRLYVNGELKASANRAGTSLAFDGAVTYIGATPNVLRAFVGEMEKVDLFDRALCLSEIRILSGFRQEKLVRFNREGRHFDGSHYVNIGPVKTLSKWTVAAWVRPETAGNGKNVLSNDRSGWNDDVLFGIRPEETYAGGSDNRWGIVHQDRTDQVRTAVYDTEDVVPGQWYHIAGTSDGQVLRLYVNGRLKDSAIRTGAALTFDGATTYIGSSLTYAPDPFRGFQGEIQEVQMFENELSSEEIELIYGERSSQFPTYVEHVPEGASALKVPTAVGFLNGNAVISDLNNDRFLYKDEPGGLWHQSPIPVNHAHSVTWSSGNYYAVDTDNHRVLEFSDIAQPSYNYSSMLAGVQLSRPHDILLNSLDGNLYVIDGTRNLFRFSNLANPAERMDLSSLLGYARSLSIVNHDVYIINSSMGEVIKITNFSDPANGWVKYQSFGKKLNAASGSWEKTGLVLNDVEYFNGYWYGSNFFTPISSNPGDNFDQYRLIRWKTWDDFSKGNWEDLSHRLPSETVPYYFSVYNDRLYVAIFNNQNPGSDNDKIIEITE